MMITAIEILTEREKQIIRLTSQGQSYQSIAENLTISRETVKKHLHHIYGKLGVSNKIEAINKVRIQK
jgi:LuxR family maltose regulon positive regulatory protein